MRRWGAGPWWLYAIFPLVASALQADGIPEHFAIANVCSDNAAVFWISEAAELGAVALAERASDLESRSGTYRLVGEDAGPVQAHAVTLGHWPVHDNRRGPGGAGLRSATDYVFDVVSGARTFDNGGAHFSFRTPAARDPVLALPQPAVLDVTSESGSPPAAAIFTYRLRSGTGQSQLGGGLVLLGDGRILDLAQLLDERLEGPWAFSARHALELSVSAPGSGVSTLVTTFVEPDGSVKDLPVAVLPSANRPPVANAGPDRVGVVGEAVALQGSAVELDPGDRVTYLWSQNANNPSFVTLTNPAGPNPAFTPTVPGLFRFTLTVTDSRGETSADTATVTVSAADDGHGDHAGSPGATGTRDTLVFSSEPDTGLSTSGTLSVANEQDWFVFYARRGGVYSLELDPDSLPAATLTLYERDGATVIAGAGGTFEALRSAPELRPSVDGHYFLRVTANDARSTGTYRVSAGVRRELLAAPPAVSVELSRGPSGYQAALRTGGTTVPLSNLNVLLAYEGATLEFANPRRGPAASEFAASFLPTLPTLLTANFDASPLRPIPTFDSDALAFVDFRARSGTLPGPGAVSILSVAATNNATSVQVFRPAADPGLPLFELSSRLPGGRVSLDGRRSVDSNRPARPLEFDWQQQSGPSVELSEAASAVASFAPPRPGLYRFSLSVSNGVLESPRAEVVVGIDLPLLVPSAAVGVRDGDSPELTDATTQPLRAIVGTSVTLDASRSSDPRGRRLAYSWSQADGPATDLSGAGTSFIFTPRVPGAYLFRVTVRNADGFESRPVEVRVLARASLTEQPALVLSAASARSNGTDLGDAPELSTPLRTLRVAAGEPVTLAALVTAPPGSIPQLISFFWRQIDGPVVALSQRGGTEGSSRLDSYVDLVATRAGAHTFECRVRQTPSGTELERRIRILVDEPGRRVPTATATVVAESSGKLARSPKQPAGSAGARSLTGRSVILSGTGNVSGPAPDYRWVQIAGPEVALSDPRSPLTSFVVPELEGERFYAFQLFVDDGTRSPPAVATVLASPPGSARSQISLHAGLNLVSVPLSPSRTQAYTVQDLARDSGSPLVAWTEAAAGGHARFRTWIRDGSGTAPPVEAGAGYILRPPGVRQFPLTGEPWPDALLDRLLGRGVNVVGWPAISSGAGRASSLLSASGGSFVARARPGQDGIARLEPHVPGLGTVDFELEPGAAYLVGSPGGRTDLRAFRKSQMAPAAAAEAPSASVAQVLRRDWNLVGLAVEASPPVSRAADLASLLSEGGARITRVLRWTGSSFEEFATAAPASTSDFPVRVGEGYFVFNAGVEASVQLTGRPIPGADVALGAGFNVISAPVESPVAAADVIRLAALAGGDVRVVQSHAGARFLSFLPGSARVSSPVELSAGQGLVLLAARASTLRLGNPPAAPAIGTASLPEATRGVPYSFRLEATGTAPVLWSLQGGALPPGIALSPEGLLSGTPTLTGAFLVRLRAGNLAGVAEAPLTLSVREPSPPAIQTAAFSDGVTGIPYAADLEAEGTGPISWSLVAGSLPAGLSVSAAGTVSGTPSAEGGSSFTVQASNLAGTALRAFTLIVRSRPIVLTQALPDGTRTLVYRAVLSASGTQPLSWTLVEGSLPPGLALSSSGVLEGTAAVDGSSTFTVRATNGVGTAERELTVTVQPPEVPAVVTASLPDGIVGVPYSRVLEANGTPPIVWTALLALPAGLELDPAGTITGTPLGEFDGNVALQAANSAGTRFRVLTLKIRKRPKVLATAPIAADLGFAIEVPLAAEGTPPLSWSVIEGGLPEGLTLATSGVVSGVPAEAVTTFVVVRAENLAGSHEQGFAVSVASAPEGLTFLGVNARGLGEFRNEKDGSELIAVPAGTFPMGTTTPEARADLGLTRETPLHTVSLRAYFIGKYELTNAQYRAFLEAADDPDGASQHGRHHALEHHVVTNASHVPEAWDTPAYEAVSSTPDSPVVSVHWFDAWAYGSWAGLRLPTEAEWERAARGADRRLRPWGNQPAEEGGKFRANAGGEDDGFAFTAPVGSFGPGAPSPRGDGLSATGAFDMAGNAAEWCLDVFDSQSYSDPTALDNPQGPALPEFASVGGNFGQTTSGTARFVIRSVDGFFASTGPAIQLDKTRTGYRDEQNTTGRFQRTGIRIARSLGPIVAPDIVTEELPPAREGVSYSASVVASGTQPVSWYVSAGALPPGLRLAAAGLLHGTPSVAGDYTFGLTAINSAGSEARSFELVAAPSGLTLLGRNEEGLLEYRNEKDGSVLIEVPASTFLMGMTTAEVDAIGASYHFGPEVIPRHAVTLDSFMVGKFEVTKQQYLAFLADQDDLRGPKLHEGHHPDEGPLRDHDHGLSNPASNDNLYSPTTTSAVVTRNFYDAVAYCAWAGLRLPTEAEWERSARGTDLRKFPWGNEQPDADGVYRANYFAGTDGADDGYPFTAPGGSFPIDRSPVGAFDMGGNAGELVYDYSALFYADPESGVNPLGPATGTLVVLRGGGWSTTDTIRLRGARRDGEDRGRTDSGVGIRVARTSGPAAVPPSIATTTLPDGAAGASYSETLAATGTTPIYWEVVDGSLPEGLQLSLRGSLSGTPAATGTATFTVRALNAATSESRAYTLTIAP